MRILIAQDEVDTALACKMILEERNHQVEIAYDGRECLDIYIKRLSEDTNSKIHSNKDIQAFSLFDVVVLDYKMPKMNGMQVAKEIFAINPHQRIIFASAYGKEILEESKRQELKLQNNVEFEIIQKPFDQEEFINTIEDISSK